MALIRPGRLASGILLLALLGPAWGLVAHQRGPSARSSALRRAAAPRMQAWTEPDFSPVVVREVRPSTGAGLYEVVIEASDALVSAYTIPGQFVQLRPSADVKPSFFAIANPPRPGLLEFLVKEAESTAWLSQAAKGSGALMCAPMGKGYATDVFTAANPDAAVSNVAFCVAGTGIAPIRALIESDGILGGGRTTQLFYGCRSLETMAYQDRFDAWKALGVQIVPVLSRDPAYAGARGYVQDSLPALLATPAETAIVLCGGNDMQAAVKETAAKLGVAEERVLTNF
jgi:ferredoxin-NADP reductase